VIEISTRYARRHGAFRAKATLDADLRPGELEAALARARRGDRRALAYLYLRFADNVYGYARAIVGDDHAAEDVAQQVFVRVLGAIARHESRGVPFSAWLLRITRNVALDHLRRRRALPCAEVPVPEEPETEEARAALALALREALAELPEGQREVVVLRHLAGWSPAEIARRLGRSESSVHALHHRGRRALRASLARRGAVPAAA
jgi:RNA polymerase sigma-70 factor (ECF subfamily)